ncbi:MAG TPA: glycoside hydrolase family 9 protein [Chitinophagaceae bacterium]|jgi:peptidoglycan/xylan/chitin deacetylase (PgdA/CDA1 family)|nr:glycoside hydrolase family 9 protein [Chitinophagaceae bacterium]
MYRYLFVLLLFGFSGKKENDAAWIRINLLGYQPSGVKVAVWCSKEQSAVNGWQLVDANSKNIVASGTAGKAFGSYGPFKQTYRLNFSSFKKPGRYFLQAGGARSPEFEIGDNVYKGAADFCLRYMRQQRSGFNPFLKDSCHTHDGYVLYGEKAGIKDSMHIDVVGGWHDASDYLQYSTTSANATYHLLAAYRDFPNVFTDEKLANGLDGKNGMADVLDEAKWGLDWLLKMHPREDWMFNQLGDDRDHMGMRIPKEDTNFYGKGLERPVYFLSGEPQQRGKFMNATTGTSSTAGKFASAFALGSDIFSGEYAKTYSIKTSDFSRKLYQQAYSAFSFGYKRLGNSQTASVRSPYIYAEDNWKDDMELGASMVYKMHLNKTFAGPPNTRYIKEGYEWAKQESITPWLGADTAKHYQWYPFINVGHYELAKQLKARKRDTIIGFYKEGINRVWNKAKQNAFYRGIPFIWCSNNLTTSFAIQCYWYKQLTGDKAFDELEQANFDWLFGCNPWGTSMVYGLPSWGDTPIDPHSAFTHLKNYPIDGGLVDGPVYTSIYKNLIGITLYQPDEYEEFQSGLAVYHDDYGDYSTNEPTMDGTASLIYLLAAKESESAKAPSPLERGLGVRSFTYSHGGIIRGDSTKKNIALVFTGHEFAEGGEFINQTLQQQKIKASFFFTGKFYENPSFKTLIGKLIKNGNYLGPHSYEHLLYCDWNKRDSLLVAQKEFTNDLLSNLDVMHGDGINTLKLKYFLPPYEWYNDSITSWTKQLGLQLINYTPGTLSHADYTTSNDKNYRSSKTIYNSIIDYETSKPAGLNGFMLLMHIGAGPDRTDKFYARLPELIKYLKQKGYQFQTVDQLLSR